jgi:hypothetical protein
VCERRVARRRGARARRSVRVNPIPNPDPNPNQAPQMSLKEEQEQIKGIIIIGVSSIGVPRCVCVLFITAGVSA